MYFLGTRPHNQESLGQESAPSDELGELVWRTSPKIEIIDFIKLAYAFHHSGILQAKSGNVTETVEFLANSLNYPIPKQWSSNLSKCLANANNGFDHYAIFSEIRGGFESFLDDWKKKREKKEK